MIYSLFSRFWTYPPQLNVDTDIEKTINRSPLANNNSLLREYSILGSVWVLPRVKTWYCNIRCSNDTIYLESHNPRRGLWTIRWHRTSARRSCTRLVCSSLICLASIDSVGLTSRWAGNVKTVRIIYVRRSNTYALPLIERNICKMRRPLDRLVCNY